MNSDGNERDQGSHDLTPLDARKSVGIQAWKDNGLWRKTLMVSTRPATVSKAIGEPLGGQSRQRIGNRWLAQLATPRCGTAPSGCKERSWLDLGRTTADERMRFKCPAGGAEGRATVVTEGRI
mmetsp:Transcript_10827/g.23894  ORF Transcript_10827/g.23894 Transcript_10827/m.23894 type:complete len:123 (+) Transcript_10827:108-476(+)